MIQKLKVLGYLQMTINALSQFRRSVMDCSNLTSDQNHEISIAADVHHRACEKIYLKINDQRLDLPLVHLIRRRSHRDKKSKRRGVH